jgi:hypothetical protein
MVGMDAGFSESEAFYYRDEILKLIIRCYEQGYRDGKLEGQFNKLEPDEGDTLQ